MKDEYYTLIATEPGSAFEPIRGQLLNSVTVGKRDDVVRPVADGSLCGPRNQGKPLKHILLGTRH